MGIGNGLAVVKSVAVVKMTMKDNILSVFWLMSMIVVSMALQSFNDVLDEGGVRKV